MPLLLRQIVLALALLALPATAFGQTAGPGSSVLTNTTPSVPVQADSDRRAAIRAETRDAAEHRAAAQQAADAGGMPQLNFANPLTIAQVVWFFILFGGFVMIATLFLLPPVQAVLEDRRARIAADLDAARDARAQAEAAEAGHRDSTARARAEAQASVAAAVKAAQGEAQGRAETLAATLNARIEEAETRIGRARDAAMGALREAATDATEAVVKRLSGLDDRAAVVAAVDRQLAARNLGGRAT